MSLPAVYARGRSGAPIFFMHGVGGDHSSWRPQLRSFGDSYRVFAWDMPRARAASISPGGMAWMAPRMISAM